MRIVVLGPSLYSETACAMAAHLAAAGHVPVGALSLNNLNRGTLTRKLGQWGAWDVARYARAKLLSPANSGPAALRNPHLGPFLEHNAGFFESLRTVGTFYNFPVAVCKNQNGPDSIALLRGWSPDLIIFTGGNILRKPLLDVPRLGVLNVHLGLLPEIRGMSSPEWSLLNRVPVGVTIHYMDAGIDTGAILKRCIFPDGSGCESLSDLRYRLIAFGVEKAGEVVADLARDAISATPQPDPGEDRQFFVMHEWLQALADQRLRNSKIAVDAGTIRG